MNTIPLRILSVSIAVLSFTFCQRHYSIEDRARSQVMVSLTNEIHDFEPESELQGTLNLKTVYVNDSICILQLTPLIKDSTGRVSELDLQYVYYVDMFLSRHSGRFLFRDAFRTVPCMTDEEIRRNAIKVKDEGENVYDTFFGCGNIIRDNFDD